MTNKLKPADESRQTSEGWQQRWSDGLGMPKEMTDQDWADRNAQIARWTDGLCAINEERARRRMLPISMWNVMSLPGQFNEPTRAGLEPL